MRNTAIMKYERDDSFRADFACLSPRERALFLRAVEEINRAYTQRGDRFLPIWPAHLRIRPISGYTGIFELTWSFAGPNGRATFELVTVDGESAIRWRHISDHRIFKNP